MKQLIVFCIFTISLLGQEDKVVESYFNLANSFYSSGDYLFAAKLYKLIESTSKDSLIAAEALYQYISSGKKAAQDIKSRFYLKDRLFNKNKGQIWTDTFEADYEKSLQLFKDSGLEITCDTIYPWKYYDLECWCNINSYYKRLTTVYKNTVWAERILFENIKMMENVSDYIEEDILKASLIFIEHYPKTNYLFNVNLIIAQCYSDMWNNNRAEEARLESIKFYNKIMKMPEYLNLPENSKEFINEQYSLLLEKKHTRHYFYGRC